MPVQLFKKRVSRRPTYFFKTLILRKNSCTKWRFAEKGRRSGDYRMV
jgi:hypothetical protein